MSQAPTIDVYFVDTKQGFKELQQYIQESDFQYVSLDLETDSKSEKKAQIFGIGLCFNDNEAFYIPIRNKSAEHFWSADDLAAIYRWVAHICQAKKLIGWNLVYDTLVFENNSGYNISRFIYSDGILQKHTLDEERPFGLKECAVKYLGAWADKAQQALYENIEANGGRTTKDDLEMWKADTDVLGEYCGWDTVLAFKLFNLFEVRLGEEGLLDLFYKEEIMPLYREVTVDMKRRGFPVDVEYFKSLRTAIRKDIDSLEDAILTELGPVVAEFEQALLDKDYPIKASGTFPKILAYELQAPLPRNKEGNITLAKKAILQQLEAYPEHRSYYDWLLGLGTLPQGLLRQAQRQWFYASNADRRYVFNLKSNDHLAWLLFEHYGETPASHTETGKPQCDDDYLDSIKDRYEFVKRLVDFKKLMKLSSTYIDGILERQYDGVIYTSMLQFGTTSGRYSSRDPNLQNIPRVKDDEANLSDLVLRYTNAIKRGFVAPAGFKIVNADYSSLEPVCFAHVSNEERLRDVFRRGYDLYSAIAIDVFGLTDCSADKKAPNYLKKKYPEKRQIAKVFCLAVVYGAEAGRISQLMGIEYQEAEEIIRAYLDAYPELKSYMLRCDALATSQGIAKTEFGRIRHLPVAKALYGRWGDRLLDRKFAKRNDLGDVRYKLKNALNNSKNFPIQGLAAHIVNRAMIACAREFRAHGIDGYISMQVHDEITCIVREDQVELASKILKKCMEETTRISVPLQAEPLIAQNWAEAK